MMLRADEKYRVDVADCRAWLGTLPTGSVHACITSPPYFGLRDYNVVGQIGLEPTPAEYVAEMVAVFREVRRVLRDDGTLWLNLGDSYAASGMGGNPAESPHRKQATNAGSLIPGRKAPRGYKAKDLLGIPWMVAFALRDDGWYLRSDCIWFKRNVMPESVKDRPSKAHEYVFMLTKTGRSYFDMEAVKERAVSFGRQHSTGVQPPKVRAAVEAGHHKPGGDLSINYERQNRNLRTVWDIPTAPHKAAHFAVMAPRLALRCLLASTSEEGVCPHCGAPWRRVVERDRKPTRPGTDSKVDEPNGSKQDAVGKRTYTGFNARWKAAQVGNRDPQRHVTETRTVGWEPGCECAEDVTDVSGVRIGRAYQPVPALVIDPFAGAGTTLYVAAKYGRRGLGCELNPEYAAIARKRLDRLGANLFD